MGIAAAGPAFSFSIHTLGCKLNQLEGEAVADAFRREGVPVIPWEGSRSGIPALPRPGAGHDPGPEPSSCPGSGAAEAEVEAGGPLFAAQVPRLMVLNTCTVTSMAEQKARRLIRGALREGACVLVTGCYAQLDAAELGALGTEEGARGGLFVVPGDKKSALLDLPGYLAGTGGELSARIRAWLRGLPAGAEGPGEAGDGAGASGPGGAGVFRFAPDVFLDHTRAFLKIQDGCDRHCTYCRVRLARGRSLSLPHEEALRRLRVLEAGGCAEAVLTGVNICRYASGGGGIQGGGSMGLGGLLNYLLGGTRRIRLRLSSLNPDDIDQAFLESLADERLRPHFHLSVQSGSGRVLRRMGRLYGPERVEWAVSQLRKVRGDPFLACDIITGFPGEGEAEFRETEELCGRADFAWIHGFPYSPRRGTAAWSFGEQTPQREAASRAARLLDLARRGRRNYVARWLGKEVELVPEAAGPGRPSPVPGGGFCVGTSENYLKILVPRPWLPAGYGPGGLLRCRLRRLSELPGAWRNDSPAAGDRGKAGALGSFDALGCPAL